MFLLPPGRVHSRRTGGNWQRRSGPVLKELSVELGQILIELGGRSARFRVFHYQFIQGALGKTSSVAGLDQTVAVVARRPITHAFTCNIGDAVGYEAPCRVPPFRPRCRAEI